MPSFDEVIEAFPAGRLLINVKSDDPAEGVQLANALGRLSATARANISVYGGDRPVAVLRERVADIRTMSRSSLRACDLTYAALGWSGYVPEACRRSIALVPLNIGPWLWGWPNRFVARMAAVGTSVFAVGDYGASRPLAGLDNAASLRRLPAG